MLIYSTFLGGISDRRDNGYSIDKSKFLSKGLETLINTGFLALLLVLIFKYACVDFSTQMNTLTSIHLCCYNQHKCILKFRGNLTILKLKIIKEVILMGKIKEQHTSKKVRYIGTEQFINAETGVVEEFQVTDIEERDFNFSKVWMRNFISTLDLVGNQKTRLAFWIIDHLNKENQLIATFRSMADETGISLFTVRETMKILQDSDFLRKVSNGVYTINPDIYFKGTRNARLNILSQYHELGETKPQLTDEQKIDQIQKSIALLQRELDKLTSKKSNIINAERVFEPSEALEN